MSKFKVGDVVQLLEDHLYLDERFVAGTAGTVTNVNKHGVLVDLGPRTITFCEHELEIVGAKNAGIITFSSIHPNTQAVGQVTKSTILLKGSDGYDTAYDIEEREDENKHLDITIRYSKMIDCWTPLVRGKRAARLLEGGSGVSIRAKNIDIYFDYDEVERVYLLLSIYMRKQEPTKLYKLEPFDE